MKVFRYFFSLFFVFFKKIRFGSRIQINPIQMIHSSTKIRVGKDAKLSVKKAMHTRRGCTLLCQSGSMNINEGLFLNQNVMITCIKRIVIGKEVTIANNVVIVDHDHNYKSDGAASFISNDVIIGDYTWIGANSVILRGAVIGDHCVIAAGTVVRRGVYPPYSIIYDERVTKTKGYSLISSKEER